MRASAIVFIASLGSASVASAQSPHPFSVHDMLAMERISDPRISPDGKSVAFTVRVTDVEANRGRTDIWIAGVDGSQRTEADHARGERLRRALDARREEHRVPLHARGLVPGLAGAGRRAARPER